MKIAEKLNCAECLSKLTDDEWTHFCDRWEDPSYDESILIPKGCDHCQDEAPKQCDFLHGMI